MGFFRQDNTVGCRGLLHNNKGNWIGVFNKHLGKRNTTNAELWGVLTGLHLALHKGVEKVMIQVDNNRVFTMLQAHDKVP